jgi:ribosome assembly protein YihI (activator of Der GTPase)
MAQAETMEAIKALQQSLLQTDSHLQKVEAASKFFGETQQKIDDKMDFIYKMMQTWNLGSECGSAEKAPRAPHSTTPSPSLTADEYAFLKK